MNRVLLDTSAYSAFRRGDERVKTRIQEAAELFLTPVIIGELLAGFKGGSRERENVRSLHEVISSPRMSVLSVEEETAEHYAAIHAALRRAGTPVSSNDLWIAASAAQHGLHVLTLDDHFLRIPHLLVEFYAPER